MERELLLLGLLRRQDMHGYELYDFIESYMQACTDIKKSTAYYLLDKLAKNGFVDETKEQSGNRPVRTVYKITPNGEQHFQALLRENLKSHTPTQFTDIVGLAFLDAIPNEEAIPLLKQRQQYLVDELTKAEAAPLHPGSFQYIISHQIAHLSAEISWLESVIAALN